MRPRRAWRLPVMALAGLALLTALWAGLVRFGWPLPAIRATAFHGALMVCGFLGTLISLERAAALGRLWTLAAPASAALGAAAMLLGEPVAAQSLWVGASLVLLAVFALIYRLQPSLHAAILGTGAAAWLCGNALWLAGLPLDRVAPWWAAFLVLTIAGERLELSRLRRLTPASRVAFASSAGLLLAGLAVSLRVPDAGVRLAGLALLALALWLLRQDVARRTVRQPGATRFIALCLLAGYAWLLAAGALWAWTGAQPAGLRHDAALHAVFLGFVMSMIFGHALIIIPGVLGVSVPFRPGFYGHLVLLHLSLLLRVAGDLAGSGAAARWGALLNVAAVLLFLAATVRAAGAARAGPGAAGTRRRVGTGSA